MKEKPADDVKLLPCPFCGSDADVSEGTQGFGDEQKPWWYIECLGCSATGESVEAWNKRHEYVGWRSCEQGVPPVDQLVIARTDDGMILLADRTTSNPDRGWSCCGHVTHWMPLPEAPSNGTGSSSISREQGSP